MRLFSKKFCNGRVEQHLMHRSWDVCPNCLRPVVGWIVALDGKFKGQDFRLRDGKNIIGKSIVDSNVIIDDESIGKQHVKITYANSEFHIVDLDSPKGTFVNGTQIRQQQIIDNDIVKLGDIEFKFKCL